SISDACPSKNATAAALAGRRCRKPCQPQNSRCRRATVCLCDHECGYSCINLANFCPVPPTVAQARNITITRGNSPNATAPYRYNDRARYVCEPGYDLVTDDNHLCHGRRGWTGSSICTPQCGRYDAITVREKRMICGQICRTDSDCATGYQCRCDESCGLRCVRNNLTCEDVPAVRNATIQYVGSGLDRIAHYICAEGFYLASGSTSRRCAGSGTWDGIEPTCERITCSNPSPAIRNTGGRVVGWVRGPYYVGTQFSFACRSNQRLIGSRTRRCESNGRWSGVPIACDNRRRQNEIRCSHPGYPVNGRILRGGTGSRRFQVGQQVTFACDYNYVLVGEPTQTCLYHLQWSGSGAPVCVDPRFPDDAQSAAQQITRNSAQIAAQMNAPRDASLSRSITAGHEGGNEIYFLIDLSRSVSDDALKNSLLFAEKLVTRFAGGTNKTAHYGIIVFASRPNVTFNSKEEISQLNTTQIVKHLRQIYADKNAKRIAIGSGTNTGAALTVLKDMLAVSYQEDRSDDRHRHCFIFTDGKHNDGQDPVRMVQRILLEFHTNPPQFYSISSCEVCRRGGRIARNALKELRGLAGNKPENFVRIESFHLLQTYVDQVIDVRIDYSKCGQAGKVGSVKNKARFGRVLGGSKAVDRAWPWQAIVTIKATHPNVHKVSGCYSVANFLGGGSIINNKWVLTAYHLFADMEEDNTQWYKIFRVTFGFYRRPISRNDFKTKLSPTTTVFNVEKITKHPQYNYDTYDYDIALIELGQQVRLNQDKNLWLDVPNSFGWVNYTDYIRPVCIPCMPNNCLNEHLQGKGLIPANSTAQQICDIEKDYVLSGGENQGAAVVTGYGHETEREAGEGKTNASLHLKQGLVKLKPDNICVQFIQQWREIHTDRMICASSASTEPDKVTDACKGDSGGPLVRELYNENNRKSCWVQVGIVSWGYGCGKSTHLPGVGSRLRPGIYTNLPLLMPWVNQTISEN
uniref:C3/C5 convertase n=1 Tax=Ciona savignyi TaxID=51511 RepID=H2YT17_CIOSA